MKILKKIGNAILILIALTLVIALFVKKEYMIESDVVIAKPKSAVFEYVKYQKNQDHYNKWVMTDPNMKKNFRGTDGTVGFVYEWNGNKQAGEGEQEIKSIEEGKRIDTEIRFKRPFEATGSTYLITDSIDSNQTKVTWGMRGKNPYPLNIMNLFMGSMLKKDIDYSLNLLKNEVEKK